MSKLTKIVSRTQSLTEYIMDRIRSIDGKKRFCVYNSSSNNPDYKRNYYFLRVLPKDEWRYSTFRPQVSFFETHGPRECLERSTSPVKIFCTGENVHSAVSPLASQYRDNCVEDAHLSLGFDYLDHPHYMRFPLWLLYFFGPEPDRNEVASKVRQFNERSFTKESFCALVATHDKTGIRSKLHDFFSVIGTIQCPGKFLHNDDDLGLKYGDDKAAYLEKFRFNLCPENDASPGYVTEKIFQALWSDCIPIYWGAERNPEPEVLNPDSFVFVDPANPSDAIRLVRELENNPVAYAEFKSRPKLLPGAADWICSTLSEAKERILTLAEQG